MEEWDGYTEHRRIVSEEYVRDKLHLVRKTTFLFIPNGTLQLDEPPYVQMDPELVGDLHKFLFMNAGLGNRCPTKTGIKFKICVACALKGHNVRMCEIHLILGCPRYDTARQHLQLTDVIEEIVRHHGVGEEGYGAYWGKGLGLPVDQLRWRLQCAIYLRDHYLEDIMVMKPLYYRYRLHK